MSDTTTGSATPSTTTVRIDHHFNALPQQVFNAWIDPAQASRWLFATPAGRIVRTDIDARVGGRFSIVDRRDGEDVEHVGDYVELDPPRRLAFDFSVPELSAQATRVSVDIAPVGTGCELSLTHEGVARDFESRTENGWKTMLTGLEDYLRGETAGG